jgi:hypothetical protein
MHETMFCNQRFASMGRARNFETSEKFDVESICNKQKLKKEAKFFLYLTN